MRTSIGAGAAALLAAVTLTACTSSSSTSPSTTSPSATSPSNASASSTPPGTTGTSTSASAKPTVSPSASALAAFTAVTGTSTTLRFDPAFVRALYTNGLTSRPTGKATLTPVGTADDAKLPISGGSATVYAKPRTASSRMTLQHAGSGLTVSSASRSVRVTDFVLSFGAAPQVTATVRAVNGSGAVTTTKLVLFQLKPTSALTAATKGGVVTISGIRTYLTKAAVQALSRALDTTAFGSGAAEYIGTITVVVRGS